MSGTRGKDHGSDHGDDRMLDLIVVGAGPTGIAIGAEAKAKGLDALLIDRGPLCGAMVDFPTGMTFFTTRDKLEIAGIPFAIPDEKPDRRQALVYYQGVARAHGLAVATFEEVSEVVPLGDGGGGEGFEVRSRHLGQHRVRRSRAVALATGYFGQPETLGVSGEELPWVSVRYLEPYAHFDQDVVIVGGGNSACETALDLWRNNARVTMVVRKGELKKTVKYWVKPDVENRIDEGSIGVRWHSEVEAFRTDGEGRRLVDVVRRDADGSEQRESLHTDAVYELIGYLPDAELERRCGVTLDPETLVPVFDPETLESNVPGLYIAGTLQAGFDTGKIFIENSRDNGVRIVSHLLGRRHGGIAV